MINNIEHSVKFNESDSLKNDAQQRQGIVVIDGKTYHEKKQKTLSLFSGAIKIIHRVSCGETPTRPDHHYLTKIEQPGKVPIFAYLEPADLTSLGLFKNWLLRSANLVYRGDGASLTAFAHHLMKQEAITVRRLELTGYDEESGVYSFGDIAYLPSGERVSVDSDGIIKEAGIFPRHDPNLIGKLDKQEPDFIQQVIDLIFVAWGPKGLLATGFYISSLFSHEIFRKLGFFPFLSESGDPRTGKSELTLILNRSLAFTDSEGLPANQVNTKKGTIRKLSQRSSLPVAILEGNGQSSFSFPDLLALYNRNTLQVRANKTMDNSTTELTFLATLVFVQNFEQFRSRAGKERVVSLQFRREDLSDGSFQALSQLKEFSPEQLASFGHWVLTERGIVQDRILSLIDEVAADLFSQGVTVDRIKRNHAVPLAGILAVLQVLVCESDYRQQLIEYSARIARQKIKLSRDDNGLVDLFFEMMLSEIEQSYTDSTGYTHERPDKWKGYIQRDGELYFHLPTVLRRLGELGSAGNFDKSRLTEQLKNHEDYLEYCNSRLLGDQMKLYKFRVPEVAER